MNPPIHALPHRRILAACFTLCAATGCSSSFETGSPRTDASAGGQSGGPSTGGRAASTGGGANGGSSNGGATSGGSSNGGSSNGGSAGSGTGGQLSTGGQGAGGGCPPDVPVNGTPCTPPWTPSSGPLPSTPIAHCSWGDDPRTSCRTTALCQNGVWSISAARCTPLLPAGCPTPPPASGSNCSDTSFSCWYDANTRCFCSQCAGGFAYPVCQTVSPPQWQCEDPSPGACPYPLPQAGSACDTPDLNCGSDCSAPIVCKDGVWQWNSCQSCCPVCASPDTPIATPSGDRAIASLKPGDLVYSVHEGAIIAVPVLRIGSTHVFSHRVVRLTLDTGRVIELSAGHPTADGRTFGNLRPGSRLDELHSVQSVEVVPYRHDATYDILPASSTGTYFAAGALVGSTLSSADTP